MSRTRLIFASLVIFHWVILGMFAFEVIPQQYRPDNTWFWFHHGGDEYGYLEQATGIINGEMIANKYPLGFPILMLPFMWVIQPPQYDALIQPISFFWAAIMFPIGMAILGLIMRRLKQPDWVSLLAIGLFTAFPLITYYGLRLIWNAQMAEFSAVHMIWAQMLTEGPTTFLTLVLVYGFLRWHDADYDSQGAVLLGLGAGFLVMIRYNAAVIPFAIAFLCLYQRQWRALIIFCICVLIGFIPQAIYNVHFFGSPLTTGYTVLDELPPEGLFSLTYFFDAIGKVAERSLHIQIGVFGSVIIGIALGIWTLKRIWHLHTIGLSLMLMWLIGYVAFYIPYFYTWDGAFFRFMIPALPAVAFCMALVIWQLSNLRQS